MARLARTMLVLCTAMAAFVASSLQGRVLCYADRGGHVAVEPPHRSTGCAGDEAHGRHDDTDRHHHPAGHSQDNSGDDRCTDVAAEFSMSRETVRSSVDHHPAAPIFAPVAMVAYDALPVAASVTRTEVDHSPPDASALLCLRTVVLLV